MYYIYIDNELVYSPHQVDSIVTEPKLVVEVGKSSALTFNLPPNNKAFDSYKRLKTPVRVLSDDAEVFRGRIVSEERDFRNIKKIVCEGDLSYLIDSIQAPRAFAGKASELFQLILQRHNSMVEPHKQFKAGLFTVPDKTIIVEGTAEVEKFVPKDPLDENSQAVIPDYDQIAINATSVDWKNSLEYITSTIITNCGGYLRTRSEADGVYLDLLETYNTTASQTIDFGVNLLDLTEEITSDELFTVLIPIGDENLTLSSRQGWSDELVNAELVEQYGRIVRTKIFDNVNTWETLYSNAKEYISKNGGRKRTVTIKALDLHLVNNDISAIRLGDKVRVNDRAHSIFEDFTCIRIDYDFFTPSNNSYTFGDPPSTLVESYRKDADKIEAREQRRRKGGKKKDDELFVDNELKEKLFYDTWIKGLADGSHSLSLGAMHKKLINMEEVLRVQVGIDLDGEAGNLNLYAMKREIDANAGKITQTRQDLTFWTDKMENGFTLAASRMTEIDGRANTRAATIEARVSENEALLRLKADKIELETTNANYNYALREIESSKTKIKQQSDAHQALVTLQSEYNMANSQQVATLQLLTNNLGQSIINLDAQVVNITGKLNAQSATINNLNTQFSSSFAIGSDYITATKGLTASHLTVGQNVTIYGRLIVEGESISSFMGETTFFNDVRSASPMYIGTNKSDNNRVTTRGWVKDYVNREVNRVTELIFMQHTGTKTRNKCKNYKI